MRRKMRRLTKPRNTSIAGTLTPPTSREVPIPIRLRDGSEHDREGHVRRNRRNHPHRGALLRDDSDGLTGGGDVRGPTYHGRAGRRGRRRRYRRRQYGAEIGRVAPRRLRDRESGDVQTESVPDQRVSGMEADTEGNAVVSEYARTRVLRPVPRTKHVAEDATLDGTYRAPGKPIKHQIPSTRSRSARTSGSRGRPNRRRPEPGRGGDYVQLCRSSYPTTSSSV